MTAQARAALERADVICGYTVYVDLVRALCPGKLIFATPMTQERERCAWALDRAAEGKTVAVVCSGDAGVYGMAGLLLQMAAARNAGAALVLISRPAQQGQTMEEILKAL